MTAGKEGTVFKKMQDTNQCIAIVLSGVHSTGAHLSQPGNEVNRTSHST